MSIWAEIVHVGKKVQIYRWSKIFVAEVSVWMLFDMFKISLSRDSWGWSSADKELSVNFFHWANIQWGMVAHQDIPIHHKNTTGNGCVAHAYITSEKLPTNQYAIICYRAMCAIVDGDVGVIKQAAYRVH